MIHNKILMAHYEGDDFLEKGVLAELKGDPVPAMFKNALERFEEASTWFTRLDEAYNRLIAIHEQGKLDQTFEQSLNKILKAHPRMERVALTGIRFSNIANPKKQTTKEIGKNLLEIMKNQQSDARIVKKQLEGTIAAFRQVMPNAEKSQFASLILSGRAGFADKIQESVIMVGIFETYYTRSCMTTIAATMHAYPAGLGWLKKGQ